MSLYSLRKMLQMNLKKKKKKETVRWLSSKGLAGDKLKKKATCSTVVLRISRLAEHSDLSKSCCDTIKGALPILSEINEQCGSYLSTKIPTNGKIHFLLIFPALYVVKLSIQVHTIGNRAFVMSQRAMKLLPD